MRGKSASEALQYLFDRTQMYRRMTDQWPIDQRRYIVSSYEFYRTGAYRDDPKFWDKTQESGHHGDQDRTPLVTYEPVSERIRKEIAADLQTVQSEAEAGAKP